MLISSLIFIIGFLVSLSIHEAAHAWMADRLGDPTARLSGRATINPFAHLDPIGTLLPLFLIFTGSPIIFGWGKPVPFDPFNLQNPRRDSALISLAGPMANLVLAIILSVIIRLGHLFLGPAAFTIEFILSQVIVLNTTWAIFNLLPIHPLDGGKIMVGLLPQDKAYHLEEFLNRYGLLILIFLLLPLFGYTPLNIIISPIIKLILAILLPGTP